ncbi:MAG: two-component system phosphate regulon sensor histidine kinase PhoR [Saprospiraceae bacterium]|jgi:two-component system phosphate regulon sensor histidine kinase PhoR
MKSSIIRRVVILGTLAIIGILGVQSYWVMQTWDLREDDFHRSVNIALRRVAQDLSDLNQSVLPLKNLITQVSSNYYVVNMEDVINAGQLEHFLYKEFEELAMNIDFEYAIFDCSSREMVYGNYCSYTDAGVSKEDLGKLPTLDELTYYFGVKFPSRSSYLVGKMQRTFIFTVILLLSILFFIYSIFVILRQQRLSEMQKDFINNMTHEFKTPISTIRVSSDVFLNNEVIQKDPRLYKYATIIKEQNIRLDKQVEKVLQLANIEGDSFELHKENVDIHNLIDEVLKSNELAVTEKGGVLKSELLSGISAITADRFHVTNIIHNLIDNAIKYCKDVPEIIVKTFEEKGRIQLTVEDKGIGIDKENHRKIFNKFFRVPTGNVHNVKGFGLGLFYVEKICELHGWKVDLQSELDKGTKIKITFN